MSVYKRGGVYWYKFMWSGKLIRESTKQRNNQAARNMEAAKRASLAAEKLEMEDAKRRLQCSEVLRCHECEELFNVEKAVREQNCVFCGEGCRASWAKKQITIPTLLQFIDCRFEPWAKSMFEHSSPKTWVGWYRTGLRSLKAHATLASFRMDEITGENIAEFAGKKQAEEFQVSSINATLRVLRRVLRMAAEWGVIPAAPKVKLLRGERHRERVVTPEEEARYLAAAPDTLAQIATVLVDSGMRPEECFRLRWESINWEAGRNGIMQVTHGKSAAARRLIPMTQRVSHILGERWKAVKKPEEGWVFPAPTKSEHVESSSLKKQHAGTFKRINDKIAEENKSVKSEQQKQKLLKPWVLYSFRHTFLTRLGESGCDAWTLARIAGHSNIAISQRYVHPSENAVMDAFTRLSGHKTGHTRALKQ